MFRAVLRPYFAMLLLLCLGRTLLPEVWVLAWHPHEHTTFEPAYRVRGGTASKQRLLFTARHQHCHTEQFYNVPFMPGSVAVAPWPCLRTRYRAFADARPAGWSWLASLRATLRGPPAQG